MANKEVVICSLVRTAIGTYGGTLKDTPAVDLGAVAVRATLDHAKLSPGDIDTVVMGNVIQAGNKRNPARQAAIYGGVPVDIPAMTVNRVCGSGAQAIVSAAQEVMLGFIDSAVAGGMENMDRAPYLMTSGRWGYRMGDGQIFDAMLMDGLRAHLSRQTRGSELPMQPDRAPNATHQTKRRGARSKWRWTNPIQQPRKGCIVGIARRFNPVQGLCSRGTVAPVQPQRAVNEGGPAKPAGGCSTGAGGKNGILENRAKL